MYQYYIIIVTTCCLTAGALWTRQDDGIAAGDIPWTVLDLSRIGSVTIRRAGTVQAIVVVGVGKGGRRTV